MHTPVSCKLVQGHDSSRNKKENLQEMNLCCYHLFLDKIGIIMCLTILSEIQSLCCVYFNGQPSLQRIRPDVECQLHSPKLHIVKLALCPSEISFANNLLTQVLTYLLVRLYIDLLQNIRPQQSDSRCPFNPGRKKHYVMDIRNKCRINLDQSRVFSMNTPRGLCGIKPISNR